VPKVVGSGLATKPNAIGFGYKGARFGLAARPNAIGSDFQPHSPILSLVGPPNIFNFIFFSL